MNHFYPAKQQQKTSISKKVSTLPETKQKFVATKLTPMAKVMLRAGLKACQNAGPLGVSYSMARSAKAFESTDRTCRRALRRLETTSHAVTLKVARGQKLNRYTQRPNRVIYSQTPINLSPQEQEFLRNGHLVEGQNYQILGWKTSEGDLMGVDDFIKIAGSAIRCLRADNLSPLKYINPVVNTNSSRYIFSPPNGDSKGGGEEFRKGSNRRKRTARPPIPGKGRPTPKAPQNSQKAPPRRQNASAIPRLTLSQKNATATALGIYAQHIHQAPISEAVREKFEREFLRSGIDGQTLISRMQAIADSFMLRQVTLSPNRVFHFEAMMRSAVFIRQRFKQHLMLARFDRMAGLNACMQDIAIRRWFFGDLDRESLARAIAEVLKHFMEGGA